MRKLLFILFFSILSTFTFANSIIITDKISHFYAGSIILEADKANVTGSDSKWKQLVLNAMKDKIYNDDKPENLVLFDNLNQITSDGYPWAFVGYKIYLSDDKGNSGPYLGYLSFTIHGNPSDQEGIISNINYSDKGIDPKYSFQTVPSVKYINGTNFEVHGDLQPPIITNSGWSSGMGNTNSQFIPDASFWVQDYGINETGRWIVDSNQQAIQQSTQPISGTNVGSRAYPVIKNSNGEYVAGNGGGHDGVWQIDMKIGSNGGGDLCETFYLAERKNFAPGPENYLDGSGGAAGGIGREIDIMETKWHPGGPQVNLATAGNSSWNASMYQSVQMANWSDIGGAPTKQFVTFGAYIKDKILWIYAYKPDGTIWYSTNAIPLNNSIYVQNGPFVPYIGTWGSRAGNFSTEYKNFIYLPAAKIPDGINPKDNPEEFFKAVQAANSK